MFDVTIVSHRSSDHPFMQTNLNRIRFFSQGRNRFFFQDLFLRGKRFVWEINTLLNRFVSLIDKENAQHSCSFCFRISGPNGVDLDSDLTFEKKNKRSERQEKPDLYE